VEGEVTMPEKSRPGMRPVEGNVVMGKEPVRLRRSEGLWGGTGQCMLECISDGMAI